MDYDEFIKVIRGSVTLGRNSCSWVDECLTDPELEQQLRGIVKSMKYPSVESVFSELERINAAVLERMEG